jgi:hypothetical protein
MGNENLDYTVPCEMLNPLRIRFDIIEIYAAVKRPIFGSLEGQIVSKPIPFASFSVNNMKSKVPGTVALVFMCSSWTEATLVHKSCVQLIHQTAPCSDRSLRVDFRKLFLVSRSVVVRFYGSNNRTALTIKPFFRQFLRFQLTKIDEKA